MKTLRLVTTLCGVMLWFLPRRVRLNHGAEIMAIVEHEWDARSQHGLRGAAAFVAWIVIDVARSFGTGNRKSLSGWSRPASGAEPGWGSRSRLGLSRDLRQAIRALSRNPVFTATAAVTLALGIGANTAVFSVVDRVLLRPLPYPDSDRLVVVRHPVPGYTSTEWGLSRAGYFYFRQNSQTLQDLGIYRSPSVVLTGGDRAERIDAAVITASVLTTLQVTPALGRSFTAEDDVPGAPRVMLLSHDLWMRRFGGDESIVGRTISVDGSLEEVIGVMPPGFHFPQPGTDLWRPFRLDPNAQAVNQHIFFAIGRVKAGVGLDATLLELQSFVKRFPEVFPTAYSTQFMEESQFDVSARFMLDDTVQNLSQALWIVLGTVALVLLMACANVANLNLVRAEGRRREVALRIALGADRTHLWWQYLTESFLVAAMGGVLGVGLAYLGVDLMTSFAPAGLPRMQEIGLDGRAVTVAAALTVVSALFFGTFPLARHGESSITEALKEGARSATPSKQRQRIRSGLVVSQVAIALVLLAASGLLFRTYLALRTVDLGFETENVFTARLSVVRAKYEDNDAVLRFWKTARERLAALPMVTSAGMTLQLEIADIAYDNSTEITDLPEGGTTTQVIDEKFVSAGYFETMGMRLVEGRLMDRTDQDMRAPGAIITRLMAEEYWPGRSAIGKRVRPLFRQLPWHTVVGVIEDVRTEGIRKAPEPTVYFPYTSLRIPSMAFVIRTAAPASAILSAIQREIWSLDPDVPIAEAVTMQRIVADDMARTTFTLSLLGIAAGMAVLLGAVGIYGVISYTVSRRAPEIGVRLALGARKGQVAGMVLSQTLRLALVGIAIGIGAALALNRVIASVLFGVQSTDPLTLLAVCLVLVAVAALAGYVPALRASRVDPLQSLRAE